VAASTSREGRRDRAERAQLLAGAVEGERGSVGSRSSSSNSRRGDATAHLFGMRVENGFVGDGGLRKGDGAVCRRV
jgi:hypothetical protein